MNRPAGVNPRGGRRTLKIGLPAFPHPLATGSLGSGFRGLTASTSLTKNSRKRLPRSTIDTLRLGPAGRRRPAARDPPCRQCRAVNLAARFSGGDRRANLQHVGAEARSSRRLEVVGVILHEDVPPLRPCGHHLGARIMRGGFPVALGAEAVAVGHEPLSGEAGSCLRPWRSSNVSVKPAKPPSSRKRRRPSSMRAGVAERLPPRAAVAERFGYCRIAVVVLAAQLVDFAIA